MMPCLRALAWRRSVWLPRSRKVSSVSGVWSSPLPRHPVLGLFLVGACGLSGFAALLKGFLYLALALASPPSFFLRRRLRSGAVISSFISLCTPPCVTGGRAPPGARTQGRWRPGGFQTGSDVPGRLNPPRLFRSFPEHRAGQYIPPDWSAVLGRGRPSRCGDEKGPRTGAAAAVSRRERRQKPSRISARPLSCRLFAAAAAGSESGLARSCRISYLLLSPRSNLM